ncbi:MAG: biotin transporter BioY [Phyllobacteriaceae bacterium]|nr:biotin transporter BioY [Phyllobacteriaceae bacterium]
MKNASTAAGFRNSTFTALGAGLVVALGAAPPIPLGILPVPVTLQSFGVMLAGLLLGPRRAGAAMLVVVALVAMGLPVLAGGRGGLAVLIGPTAGYLYGWVPGAMLIGALALRADRVESMLGRGVVYVGACMAGGVAVVHACGVLWLTGVIGLEFGKALWGTLLFVPGDLIKALAAALVCRRIEALISVRRH